jgi:hypothetical protein
MGWQLVKPKLKTIVVISPQNPGVIVSANQAARYILKVVVLKIIKVNCFLFLYAFVAAKCGAPNEKENNEVFELSQE